MQQKDNPIYIGILRCLFFLRAANGKGHGVHSPFVFNFIKEVLNKLNQLQPFAGVDSKQRKIDAFLYRVIEYFQPNELMLDDDIDPAKWQHILVAHRKIRLVEFNPVAEGFGGLLVLDKPFSFAALDYFFSTTAETTVVIILNKHSHKQNRARWKHLEQHKAVTLSIDLFEIGLLFFRKENYQKQYFSINF